MANRDAPLDRAAVERIVASMLEDVLASVDADLVERVAALETEVQALRDLIGETDVGAS